MTASNIHELYVWKLSKELSKEYDLVSTNVELRSQTRVLAEIDILAEVDGEVHVIEVKKSYRPTKARAQLRKIQRYYQKSIARFFMYCGEADHLIELTL